MINGWFVFWFFIVALMVENNLIWFVAIILLVAWGLGVPLPWATLATP